MTFLKLAALGVIVQGVTGSVLGALVVGVIVGDPFMFLSGDVSSIVYLLLGGAVVSLFPSLIIAGILSVILAKNARPGVRVRWTVGTACVSGAIWALIGVALGRLLVSDPYLWKVVSAEALSGVLSGAIVGFYASRL